MNIYSKKVFLLFILLPVTPAFFIIGYMSYMIEFDEEVQTFKAECKSTGGIFNFDIPKIMICNDRSDYGFKDYVGTVQMTTSFGKDRLAD